MNFVIQSGFQQTNKQTNKQTNLTKPNQNLIYNSLLFNSFIGLLTLLPPHSAGVKHFHVGLFF
jgi:hypothetical protein